MFILMDVYGISFFYWKDVLEVVKRAEKGEQLKKVNFLEVDSWLQALNLTKEDLFSLTGVSVS